MAPFLSFTLEAHEKPGFTPSDTGEMPPKSTRKGWFYTHGFCGRPRLMLLNSDVVIGTSIQWSESVMLVAGGTGSFGRRFTEVMLIECPGLPVRHRCPSGREVHSTICGGGAPGGRPRRAHFLYRQ